jgi:oxygen-independent coproporphyrinogen-3 oxidase
MDNSLIHKYNVPGPRYTSYPTVPFWKHEPLRLEDWTKSLLLSHKNFNSNEISLYIHLPFCESLCTFCGCHKRITKNHQVETPYIETLIKEWQLYLGKLDFKPVIKELHLGGGTPTFFSIENLLYLLRSIFQKNRVNPSEVELSFEAHPNFTNEAQLEGLFDFGFRRVSFGIQDYASNVQKAIHRIQTFEQVSSIHEAAKKIGYESISHDLVYGLPKQTLTDVADTVQKTLQLRPDRISLYSYAHVPWIKGNGQRGYDESDLPQNEEKRKLYEFAKDELEKAGYLEIGMDHFALAHDALSTAFKAKKLHRNFMGYTLQNTNMMIGLGMSAISDSWFAFAQNDKTVESYMDTIEKGELAIFRGHLLNDLDLMIRQNILDLMCHFETRFHPLLAKEIKQDIIERLSELIKDDLVSIDLDKISVSPKGVAFVRNICMAFDQDLRNHQSETPLFSKTI